MGKKEARILISGWFSFNLPHNTAGDLLAQQSAVTWAENAGFTCDIAVYRPSAPREVATDDIVSQNYKAVIFVCGPLTESRIIPFIQRFKGIKRIALNVSIVPTSNLSNEFDIIIPRDSPEAANPDISLASHSKTAPVIGLIYVGRQREYPNQQHSAVEEMVKVVVEKLGAAIVRIDTKLPHNEYGLSSTAQVESVIRHMDIVITTRLHGSVLSLRNGVPAIAIDPVPGGAKVLRQMRALGWPLAYTISELNKAQLEKAINTAMTKQAKELATKKIERAHIKLRKIETAFIEALGN